MVLALAPIFLDERFSNERSRATLDLFLRLTRQAIRVAGTPDTGIWELRTTPQPQTFSSLMSWAAADRAAGIAANQAPSLMPEFRDAAARIHDEITTRAWSGKLNAFAASYGGMDLDASLLEMASLRFLPPDSPVLASTIEAIQRGLDDNGWLLRYRNDDGFGSPAVAFTLCTFWLIEALATIGRVADAREVMQRICRACTPLGLLSEDIDTRTHQMWGNFPQAYSHVGLIHAAFAASPRWTDVL
jgi:GH15 family glucan-1,4-alpha-glucosidase